MQSDRRAVSLLSFTLLLTTWQADLKTRAGRAESWCQVSIVPLSSYPIAELELRLFEENEYHLNRIDLRKDFSVATLTETFWWGKIFEMRGVDKTTTYTMLLFIKQESPAPGCWLFVSDGAVHFEYDPYKQGSKLSSLVKMCLCSSL